MAYLKQYAVAPVDDPCADPGGPEAMRIWQLWLQGWENAPPLVQRCADSLDRHHPSAQVIRLTEKTVPDYIELPESILQKREKKIISDAHFSDIIRTWLLAAHGGIWVDATVLMTGPMPEEIFEADFFAFRFEEADSYTQYRIASSWFIVAQPNHIIMRRLQSALTQYWEHENSLIDYFLFHKLFTSCVKHNQDAAKQWNQVPILYNHTAHKLQEHLKENFDREDIKKLMSETPIHKLTHHKLQGWDEFDKQILPK